MAAKLMMLEEYVMLVYRIFWERWKNDVRVEVFPLTIISFRF